MPTVPFYTPRVQQAPIANTRATVSSSAADFGSQTAAAIGNAGAAVGQAGDLLLKKQNEDDQRFSMEAFNQFQVDAGKSQIAYQALQGMDVTPEAKQKHLEEVNNARIKYREGLSVRGQQMYDQATGHANVAMQLDADKHFTVEGKQAADEARNALVGNSFNAAGVNPTSETAKQQYDVGISAISSNSELTDARKEQLKILGTSGLTRQVVTAMANSGDVSGAQAYLDEKAKTGLVDADTQADLTKHIERAGQSAQDDSTVKIYHEVANKDIPVHDIVDIDSQELQVDRQIASEVDAGGITAEEGKRYSALSQAQYADQRRRLHVVQGVQARAASEQILGAGGLTAARAVITDVANDPDRAWMTKGLEQQTLEKYGTEAQKQAAEDAHEFRDPKWRYKAGEAISRVIDAAGFPDEETMVNNAFALGLGQADVTKLREQFKNGGAINGLTQESILKAVTDPVAKKQYEKNPEDLYQLWMAVRDGWDPKEKPDEQKLHDRVAQYRWQGFVGNNERTVQVPDGKGGTKSVPVTQASAITAGRQAEFRADFADTGNRSLKAIKDEMTAAGINPDPTTPGTPEHKGLVPVVHYEPFNALADYLRGPDMIPGVVPAVPGVSTEANPDDAERFYMMAKYGVAPKDFNQATQSAAERKAYTEALGALGAEAVKKHTAEADLSAYLDTASYGPKGSGIHGVEAARRQLEDALANDKVPDWLQKYNLEINGQTLDTSVIGKGSFAETQRKDQRIRVRAAFLQAMQSVR